MTSRKYLHRFSLRTGSHVWNMKRIDFMNVYLQRWTLGCEKFHPLPAWLLLSKTGPHFRPSLYFASWTSAARHALSVSERFTLYSLVRSTTVRPSFGCVDVEHCCPEPEGDEGHLHCFSIHGVP